jgi:hypothetical protein
VDPAQPIVSLVGSQPTEDSSLTQPSYVTRVGLCILEDRVVKNDRKESLQKVVTSLREDPRVKDLVDVDLEKATLRRPKFAAAGIDSKRDFDTGVPISPSVHIHALEIDPPLKFTVQIPRRLQIQKGASEESVPTDEYWVVWDGILLVVMWRYDGNGSYGTLGGTAIIKLLMEVAQKSGKAVYVQPCGPNCDYPFAHRDIRVVSTNEAEDGQQPTFKETGRLLVTLELSSEPATPYEAASKVHSEVFLVSRWYARMRSDGEAIHDIEEAARGDLRDLLKIYHTATLFGPLVYPSSWKARWRLRGWRRNARRLIARLWLALSALESRRHDWANSKFTYEKVASRQGRGLIFRTEYEDEVNYVSAMDVSRIESSVEYAASHLDTRSVAVATTAGAIAGAIVGALVGGLIQLRTARPLPIRPVHPQHRFTQLPTHRSYPTVRLLEDRSSRFAARVQACNGAD